MKEKDAPERFSLSRWSKRKLETKFEVAASAPTLPVSPPSVAAPAAAPSSPSTPAPALPSVDSLTFDSDFTAFLRPDVDETLRRAALKQLFRDPRFNVMDGLDTYIDDYTKADPIPPDVLKDILRRGFAAVAPASATSAESTVSPVSPEGVPAPVAAEPLPSTAAATAPSSESQLPQLPQNAPEPEVPPRSTS